MKSKTEKAIFAAGCFWGVEYVFSKFPGVVSTKVGYTGGLTKNPKYQEVCTDTTGHAEAVLVEFNPEIISYEKILEIFFKCHDPTTVDRQGPDYGNQYRSAIFYFSEEQKEKSERAKTAYEKIIKKKIVTSIEPAQEFYDAEEYHQKYYNKKKSEPYCHIVPNVKI